MEPTQGLMVLYVFPMGHPEGDGAVKPAVISEVPAGQTTVDLTVFGAQREYRIPAVPQAPGQGTIPTPGNWHFRSGPG